MRRAWRSDQIVFHPHLEEPPRKVSRGTVALLAGLCAIAVGLSGVVVAGLVLSDPSETASAATVAETPPLPQQPVAATAPAVTALTAPKSDRAVRSAAAPPSEEAAVEALPIDDQRWGNATAAQQGIAAEAPADEAGETRVHLAAGPDDRVDMRRAAALEALSGLKSAVEPDVSSTASIPATGEKVVVAETEAEVAKLEAATGMIDGAPEVQGPTEGTPSLTTARVTKYVNLRAGPADEASVVAVVPANAEIEVESRCQWCAVIYDGKRGYIYKNFIRRSLKEAAAEGTGLF